MGKAILVVMAAGVGSRYKEGVKQLAPVGPGGETLLDYSICDAVEAGFSKVVFIIRRALEEDFRNGIGGRAARITEVEYVFQELEDIPDAFRKKFPDRKKPWGTGHAILCCKDAVDAPFLVINADDYYGKEAYRQAYSYLTKRVSADTMRFCMVGFILKNTLSDNGTVTRGVCKVDDEGMLSWIDEFHGIGKKDGRIVAHDGERDWVLDEDSPVSMNMWGFTPAFFHILEKGFRRFLRKTSPDSAGAEYLLPTIIGDLLQAGRVEVEVLHSGDQWFGLTYKEDKAAVSAEIRRLIAEGVYPEKLYVSEA